MSHFLDPDDSATGFATNDNMADYTGLTIRTQIAAMCLQGLLSNPGVSRIVKVYLTQEAIEFADQLIKDLNETS